mmetsp:Transcript_3053/g.12179  ORF Transcript_3053/g.12179 Transcript_3053/m.12179 type:complete len:413 (+) Transcript_3053:1643-2881(+)
MHDEKSRKRSEIGVLLRPRVLGVEVALPVAAKVVILVPHRGLDAGDVARAPPEGVRSVALHLARAVVCPRRAREGLHGGFLEEDLDAPLELGRGVVLGPEGPSPRPVLLAFPSSVLLGVRVHVVPAVRGREVHNSVLRVLVGRALVSRYQDVELAHAVARVAVHRELGANLVGRVLQHLLGGERALGVGPVHEIAFGAGVVARPEHVLDLVRGLQAHQPVEPLVRGRVVSHEVAARLAPQRRVRAAADFVKVFASRVDEREAPLVVQGPGGEVDEKPPFLPVPLVAGHVDRHRGHLHAGLVREEERGGPEVVPHEPRSSHAGALAEKSGVRSLDVVAHAARAQDVPRLAGRQAERGLDPARGLGGAQHAERRDRGDRRARREATERHGGPTAARHVTLTEEGGRFVHDGVGG